MKTLALLIVLLAAGFAMWKFGDSAPFIPDFGSSSEKTTTPTATNGTIRHTVVKGDTLHSLAKRHNTSVASIQSLNNFTGSNIRVGQQLTIRPGAQTAVKTPQKPRRESKLSLKKPATQHTAEAPPVPPAKKPKTSKALTRKQLPKSIVMESARIAIDIDDRNQVYLKKPNGTFAAAGTILYGSDADKHGNEVKTITYRDLAGKETTLSGDADPESVIRLALKNKK